VSEGAKAVTKYTSSSRPDISPRGKPLQPRFSKYHELFEEPGPHRRAADNSLTAKAASICVQ
jgi:hypothetical protein